MTPDDSLLRAQQSAKRRANIAVITVAFLVILITFLFWYQTWFGRRLSPSELNEYLTDTSVPHKTQHALSQLADQIASGDPGARRWYPQIISLASSKEPEFRLMSAWVMGQDNHSNDFHQALLKLLNDPEPMVRRNAALSLVRFGDASGREELRKMLEPYALTAPVAGRIEFRMKESEEVRRGAVVARIETSAEKTLDVHSPVEGILERRTVEEGGQIETGAAIAIIAPDEAQVWESLRALYLVGEKESLPDVQRFAKPVAGMSERVRQQAALTAQAIRKRVGIPQ
jgi:HEAT repeats